MTYLPYLEDCTTCNGKGFTDIDDDGIHNCEICGGHGQVLSEDDKKN